MIKLYCLYDTKQDRVLAIMEPDISKPDITIIGSIDPVTDGNYYREIIVSGVRDSNNTVLGLSGWWNHVVNSDHYEMSDEFGFNIDKVWIRELVVK